MKIEQMMTIETVTPTMAEKYLKYMVRNRKRKDGLVLAYATMMDDGDWALNGTSLKFNSEGRMIDGQHRCEACVLSGKSFRTYVSHGIEDDRAFATIDTGSGRSSADVFGMAGYKDQNNFAAAASRIYLYKKGLLTLNGTKHAATAQIRKMIRGTDFVDARMPGAIARKELLEYAEPYAKAIERGISAANTSKAGRMIPVSMSAALHVLFCEKDAAMADSFIHDLGQGAGLQDTDPVLVLRNKLMVSMQGHSRLAPNAKMALCIIAWNKRRAGERSKVLKLLDDAEFPKVK